MPLCVRDLMLTASPVLPTGTPIAMGIRTLLEAQASEIFVTDDEGRLLGVAPDYELLRWTLLERDAETPVDQVLTMHIEHVSAGDPLPKVIPLFRESRFATMPIVQAGRLVGVLKRNDVLRYVFSEKSDETVCEDSDAPQSHDQRQPAAPKFLRMNVARRSDIPTSF
ncbi:CBS domain-containing protein [Calycomorphotria hydatis]|uniref:Putative voltage-gated ClC-type chloride channel ClcB n=1 Tax=Calycomorphotria hydatis TaxID=2528027 RepID=A0A517T6Y7_9PLAN|nr:CBS domain-containing protein [Calycomorphotria hydatis]QDT64133.1 putative voltage-gated ClC-type chloride channel ClcB [Calycomorphotria hydatis]